MNESGEGIVNNKVFFVVISRDEYFCMKAQWKTVNEAQERRFAMLRDRKSIIGENIYFIFLIGNIFILE